MIEILNIFTEIKGSTYGLKIGMNKGLLQLRKQIEIQKYKARKND